MIKTIRIDEKDVKFRSSADTIRRYRERFGRDLLLDFDMVQNSLAEGKYLSMEELTIFENFAYTMAKQADPSIPDDPSAWLDTFEMFSIYLIWPQLVEFWQVANTPTSESKKKE